jgi:hypothetical protein
VQQRPRVTRLTVHARFSPADVERVESGIDWVSWVSPDGEDGEHTRDLGEQLIAEQQAQGSKVESFSFEGYRGWACAGTAIGSRPDSVFLRLSGSQAATKWTHLRSSSGHPTRLDVQTSFWLTASQSRFGSQFLRRSESSRSLSRRSSKSMTVTRGSDGAYCGTVGKRTSRRYLRVYDKGIEQRSHPPGIWWRYEAEVKRDLAPALWSELCSAQEPERWCADLCARWSYWSGLRWPSWLRRCMEPLPPAAPELPPDVARSLKWLREQVRPTIQRLTPAVDTETLLTALGLHGYATPVNPNREDQPS